MAFSDHKEWSGCYCTHYHWDSTIEAQWKAGKVKGGRDYAIKLIRDGVLRGYMAYKDDSVVGWCNTNDKTEFVSLVERRELWDEAELHARVKSVVCFLIAPNMRGKGIATQLLDTVCRDATTDGYEYIETYPRGAETNDFVNYHGPNALCEKCGFSLHKDIEHDSIVRKCLQERQNMSSDSNSSDAYCGGVQNSATSPETS